MNKVSGFDSWYYTGKKCDNIFTGDTTNQYYKIKKAWDHQQKKIEELERFKKEAIRQLEISANQLMGIPTALEVLGDNINVPFFIETYRGMSEDKTEFIDKYKD